MPINQSFQESALATAISAACLAGAAIEEVYGGTDFVVSYKGDHSPLTEADRRSHALIENLLSSFRPPPIGAALPLMSEEGPLLSYHKRKNLDCYWLVDPLDGTKEFIKRNGEFTVNIALIQGNKPVLGVVYVPVGDLLYFSAQGLGAYRLANSAKEAAKKTAPALPSLLEKSERLPLMRLPSVPFTIACSRSHGSGKTGAFIEEMKERHGAVELITTGSSVKLCLVAEGRAHLYPRFGPTMEWDIAAGQHIVEASGGKVLDFESRLPLRYNKEDLHNPAFLAFAPGVDAVWREIIYPL